MYRSSDRKTPKESKRPSRPVQNNSRQPPANGRISSAANNHEDENIDKVIGLVREFLQKHGYVRTFEVFKTEKPSRRPSAREADEDPITHLLNVFDRGLRDDFLKVWTKLFPNPDEPLKRLQFQLHIYFYVYAIHPVTRRSPQSTIDKATVEHFKRYLETKGSELSKTNEFLSFYALPYIQKPQEHPAISQIFTKQWINKVKRQLQQALQKVGKNTTPKKTTLQQMYAQYTRGSQDCRGLCEHVAQIQDLKNQNSEILKYTQNLQNHYNLVTQSAKANLMQSQNKWFQFSKEILLLAQKASKGQNIEQKLQKYSGLLNYDMEQLVNCTKDVSIFDRNSCVTQEVSLTPAQRAVYRKERALCPINTGKVLKLFDEAHKQQKQVQVCLVLQALRWRFNKLKNAYARRQVIVSYSTQDICAIKPQNWPIQDKLLFRSGVKIRSCYLKLLNYITSDYCGIKYLITQAHLIQNLIKIFTTEKEDTASKKHSIGVLQKLSLLKKPQEIMVSLGLVEMMLTMLGRNERQHLSQYSFQYLTALLLNLSLRKVGKQKFQKNHVELMQILYDLLLEDNMQVRNYVNGTIYTFICSSHILKEQAIRLGMQKRLKEMTQKCQQGLFSHQYQYIIEKLNSSDVGQDDCYTEDENQLDFDDIDDKDETVLSDNDRSSEDIDNQEDYLSGQELLMKQFALVGPDAVKQHVMTKSYLDQTHQKKSSNTIVMNKSRSGRDVFTGRPATPLINGVDQELERSLLRFGDRSLNHIE